MTNRMYGTSSTQRAAKRPAGLLIVMVALALLLTLGSGAEAQITAERLIGDSVSEIGSRYPNVDEAIKRFTNRDVLGAKQFLEAAVAKHPNLPPTELLMARMYFLSGNAVAGRASLEKTVQENPGDPEPYLALADQAIEAGRTIEAEALYDKGLELIEPFDKNAKRKRTFVIRCRTGRAMVAERRKNWQAAADDLEVLLSVDPDNAMGHYRMGRALFMLGKASEGYEQFKLAREKDEGMPHPFIAAALMYDQLGESSRAQQAFERAIAADRSDVNVIAAYSQWLIKTGSIEKAESLLSNARQDHPEDLNLLVLSGVAARMAKKMKPAEDYFVAALGMSPSNGSVINQLALLLVEQPDTEKRRRALEFAAINAKLNPENSDAQITLSWVSYQLGRNQDANNALRTGLQLGNLTPDSSYLVAKMLVDQNQTAAARQLLTSALEADTSGIFVNRSEAEGLLDTLGRR